MEEKSPTKRRKLYSMETLKGAIQAAKRGGENLYKLSREFGIPYSTLRLKMNGGTDNTEPVEMKETLDEGTKMKLDEILPLNLCCACLNTDDHDALLSDSLVLATFNYLLGTSECNLQLRFCQGCHEIISSLAQFKQTCIDSVEFLTKIHNVEVVDVKIEDETDISVKLEQDATQSETEVPVKRIKRRKRNIKSSTVAKSVDNKLRYCGICKKYFKNVLMPHIYDVHIKQLEDDKYHCLICDNILTQKASLRFHFDSHNTMDKPLECKICSESFVQRRAYQKHLMKHEKYECHHCARKLSTKHRLKDHILTQHTNAKRCSYCSEVFLNEPDFLEHQKLEREQRQKTKEKNRRVCDICGFNASCGPALYAHKERKHPTGEVVCDLCGRTCINRHQYKWHLREYHQEKRFTCTFCTKKFSQKAGLNKHIKIMHERSSSVSCDICGNVFTLLYSLKKHKETVHSNIYKYECKICGRGFKVNSLLKKHQFSHLNKKPFNCHLCSTGYYMVDYLKSHYLKIHELNFTSQEVKDACIRVNIDKTLL